MKKLAFIFSVLLVAVYFANLMYTDSKEAKIKLEQMLRKTTVDKAEMDRVPPGLGGVSGRRRQPYRRPADIFDHGACVGKISG